MDNTYLLQTRRTDYLNKLQKMSIPLFAEGVFSIYSNVKKNNKTRKFLLKEFQQAMVDVSRWSQEIIRNEHQRFKRAATVVDKLIQAIFDLDITLKKNLCLNAKDFIPTPWDFIHQCYLNTARALWKQPFLVYDVDVDKLTIQQNKLKVEKLIANCIQDTFLQFIPLDIEHDDITNDDLEAHRPQEVAEHTTQDNIDNSSLIDIPEVEVSNASTLSHDACVPIAFQSSNIDQLRRASISNQNLENIEGFVNSNEEQDNKQDEDNDDDNTHIENSDDDTQDSVVEGLDVFKGYGDEQEQLPEDDAEFSDDHYQDEADEFEAEDVDDTEDFQEVASFHSEDVGDVDSVKSEELFVQRHHASEEEKYHIAESDNCEPEALRSPPVIKEVFIGNRNEMEEYNRQHPRTQDVTELPQSPREIKVVTIDDGKTSSKNSLLAIKKRVKSSLYHKERFGDKVHVERRNMSFF